MQDYFITDTQTHSPRWKAAFPDAVILSAPSTLPNGSPETRCWVLASDTYDWADLIKDMASSGAQVIVMTMNASREELTTGLAAGARGYTEVYSSPNTLTQIADSLSKGALWIPAEALALLIGTLHNQVTGTAATKEAKLDQLTQRENEVVHILSQGKTNKEIARLLGISERTVKEHLGSVFSKLNVKDRLQLALLYRRATHSE
ncbi:MAG: DNA-binding response regulator [Pseudomonadaceae bacterium]|nr:MAG: DNA-binding response regulator [Pseudomonadaceae bacterium]